MKPGRTTAWLLANTATLVTGFFTSDAWLAGDAAAEFRSKLRWGHSRTIGMASAGACATISITARRCERLASLGRRRGQMPVSGVRPRSANARHECFVVDASVSVKTAETVELDDQQQR